MEPKHDGRFVELILDCVADGVFTVDESWRITSFNRAAERITGVPSHEAIGRRCSEVFHASICDTACAIRETLETRQNVIDRATRIRDRHGNGKPISVSAAVLRSEGGEVVGGVETFRDLSALEQLRREVKHRYRLEDIVGKSDALQKVFAILPEVASSDSSVLIEGPGGVGKELVARTIHSLSPRRDGSHVVVNCGSIPPNFFQSDLLTQATGEHGGKPGTLFLDDVSELPPEAQVKLLRILQERDYEPLRNVRPQGAPVRVIAATNRSLSELVSRGLFREDLYFRLAVVRLFIPPLSERLDDIPYLVEHFIQRFNAKRGKAIEGVALPVMEAFMRYDFPGNVRELESVIEYAFVLCRDRLIDVPHLPADFQKLVLPQAAQQSAAGSTPLQRAEAQTIRAALTQTRGHLGRTAEKLKISRATLWRKMKRYDIHAEPYRKD